MTGTALRRHLPATDAACWCRGCAATAPTRFLDPATPRSGQQAALGADVRDFMDALGIEQALLVGYDWGGRGACVCAALWPERVRGLVSINGYNIQNIPTAGRPGSGGAGTSPLVSVVFPHRARPRRTAAEPPRHRRLLWQLWSPNWQFDDATFEATASSFDNPDFVDVTIQSYRHRYGNAPGDPALEPLEQRLAERPSITVPTIVLHGACDGVGPPEQSENARAAFHRRAMNVA